jgi:hypothetical protein
LDRHIYPSPGGSGIKIDVVTSEATPDAIRVILAARVVLRAKFAVKEAAEAAKEEAERAELHAKLFALPVDASLVRGYGLEWVCNSDARRARGEVEKRAVAEMNWRNAVQEAENLTRRKETARAVAEKKAQEIQEAKEFRACLTSWIFEKGTDAQRGRRGEGLMSDDEILDMIRCELFACLRDFPRHVPLSNANVQCDSKYAEDGSVPEFETLEDNITLNDEQFQQLTTIRGAILKAVVTSKIHRGYCACAYSDCHFEVLRASALVTIEWNGRELSREYAL